MLMLLLSRMSWERLRREARRERLVAGEGGPLGGGNAGGWLG